MPLPASPQVNLPQPDGAKDRVGFLDNGTIRIGVNLSLGGAITYMALSNPKNGGTDNPSPMSNLINSYDWGRQIQMSHYSGPNPFAPNGKQPNKIWAGLGWNPIQSGDCFGNRSRVTDYRNDGKTLYVKCIPMQWPLDNEPGECNFECWIRLENNVAHVRSRMTNHRIDTTQYPGRSQELPAVYTNGPWYRLLTYQGDRPYTQDAVSTIPQVPPGASFPWSHWWATEHWAALLDDKDFGLGIYEPDTASFLGGFAGKPGSGGPKDSQTGYIAPLQDEILDHNIQYEYHYDLILGSLTEIRAYVYAQPHPNALPAYQFVNDRQHWRYANATDTGWPIHNELDIHLDQPGAQLLSPSLFWPAQSATKLRIEAAFFAADLKQAEKRTAQLFWRRHDAPDFSAEKRQPFEVIADGNCRTYTLDLSLNPEFRGILTGLRIDPPSGHTGDGVHIRSISVK